MSTPSLPSKQRSVKWIAQNADLNKAWEYSTEDNVPEVKSLGSDEVIVRVHYAGVNPVDGALAASNFAKHTLPTYNGYDYSGVIVALGDKVSGFTVGDEVFGEIPLTKPGAYREYAVLPAYTLVHKPKDLTHQQAASIGVVYLSAHDAFRQIPSEKYNTGATIYIPGASGGVGHVAVGIAKCLGFTVIVSYSKAEAHDLLKNVLKADHLIDYSKQDVGNEIMRITNNKGADFIYDAAISVDQSCHFIAKDGIFLGLGGVNDKATEVVKSRGATALKADLGGYSFGPADVVAKNYHRLSAALKEAAERIASKKMVVLVGKEITPDQLIHEAQLIAAKKSKVVGKTVCKFA